MKKKERLAGVDPTLVAFAESLDAVVRMKTGREIIIVFGNRSIAEQDAIYAQGRTTEGKIVTNAKGGESPHNFFAAIDAWIMSADGKSIDWNNKDYPAIVEEEIKNWPMLTWGGHFKKLPDQPHVEITNWRERKKQIV